MFREKDISVIIPTYNRVEDLKETFDSLKPHISKLNEILIIDQSKDDKTKKLIKNLRNKKIRYFHLGIPSITIARNFGIKNVSKDSKLICFLDDDVTPGNNYFSEIIDVFNKNQKIKAAGGYQIINLNNTFQKLENIAKKIFFLGHFEKDKARIISAYGNTYPFSLKRNLFSQWLPGVNMCYRKEIFDDGMKFDENLLGYTIAEDIDFSYRVYKKYGQQSIIITPFAKIAHRASPVERYPTKRMSYVNQIDHFYFYFKNLNRNLKEKLIFAWSLFGITILRLGNLILKPNKINFLKFIYYIESLSYCILNIKKIKNGKLRDFII